MANDISSLGDLITGGEESKNLRKGVITAINMTYPPSLSVQIGGSTTSVPRVAYLNSYTPVVGDSVWLFQQDSVALVLGNQTIKSEFGAGRRDEYQKLTFNYNTPGHVVIYSPVFSAIPKTFLTLVGPGTYVPSIKAGSETTSQFVIQVFDMTTGLEIPNGTSVTINVHTNGT